MRLEMLHQFNTHQGDAKLDVIRKTMNAGPNAGGGLAQSAALGIQNDADELITGMTMLHLRHCEFKPTVQQRPIYLPCTSFKKVGMLDICTKIFSLLVFFEIHFLLFCVAYSGFLLALLFTCLLTYSFVVDGR